MNDDFKISLVGELDQQATRSNISKALEEISNIKLNISSIKLSDTALKQLNSLKIQPTITGFNVDSKNVQENAVNIGKAINKSVSDTIKEGDIQKAFESEIKSLTKAFKKISWGDIRDHFHLDKIDKETRNQLKELIKLYNDSWVKLGTGLANSSFVGSKSPKYSQFSNDEQLAWRAIGKLGDQITDIIREFGSLEQYGYESINSEIKHTLSNFGGQTFYVPSKSDSSNKLPGLRELNSALLPYNIHVASGEKYGKYTPSRELEGQMLELLGINTETIQNDSDLMNEFLQRIYDLALQVRPIPVTEWEAKLPINDDDMDLHGGSLATYEEIFGYVESSNNNLCKELDRIGKEHRKQIEDTKQSEQLSVQATVSAEQEKQEAIKKTTDTISNPTSSKGTLFDAIEASGGMYAENINEAVASVKQLLGAEKAVIATTQSFDEKGSMKDFTINVKRANGTVESLSFSLQEVEELEDSVFNFRGGKLNDLGAKQQLAQIEKTVALYQDKMEKLKAQNSNIQIDTTLFDEAAAKHNVSELIKIFNETNNAVTKLKTTLNGKATSFNQVQNMLNNMRDFEQVFQTIQTDYDKIKDKNALGISPEEITALKTTFDQIKDSVFDETGEIKTQIPLNQELGDTYQNLANNIAKISKAIKERQKIEAADKSGVSIAGIRESLKVGDYAAEIEKVTAQYKSLGKEGENVFKELQAAYTALTVSSDNNIINNAQQYETALKKAKNALVRFNAESKEKKAIEQDLKAWEKYYEQREAAARKNVEQERKWDEAQAKAIEQATEQKIIAEQKYLKQREKSVAAYQSRLDSVQTRSETSDYTSASDKGLTGQFKVQIEKVETAIKSLGEASSESFEQAKKSVEDEITKLTLLENKLKDVLSADKKQAADSEKQAARQSAFIEKQVAAVTRYNNLIAGWENRNTAKYGENSEDAEYIRLSKQIEKVKSAVEELNNADTETYNYAILTVNDEIAAYQRLEDQIRITGQQARQVQAKSDKQDKEYQQISENIDSQKYFADVQMLKKQISEFADESGNAEKAIRELEASYQKLVGAKGDKTALLSAMTEYDKAVNKAKSSLKLLRTEGGKVNEFANKRLSNSITEWMAKNTKAVGRYGEELERIKRETEGANQIKLNQLKSQFDSIKASAREAGLLGKGLFQTFKELAEKFSAWFSVTSIVMGAWNTAKRMADEVRNIDSAMTELYKVTDETSAKYNQFLTKSYDNAKKLGRSVSDLVEQTATWAKLGYSLDEASNLAQVSTIYANVGEVDNETAVSDLVTSMKAKCVPLRTEMCA